MNSVAAVLACLLIYSPLKAVSQAADSYPAFGSDVAYQHEIKPLRHYIPINGVRGGLNQYRLQLTVSPAGDVLDARAAVEVEKQKYWPDLKAAVSKWKFSPFTADGNAVTAFVEEYVELVPPESFPTKHVPAPTLRPASAVIIRLQRTVCYGTCPAYTVSISTTGIVFEGERYVAENGKHTASVDPDKVRKLAKKFIDADFYSMDNVYRATVTDNPTYLLTISIDGHTKSVQDYVGSWVGMPAIVSELEDDVDTLANSRQWIKNQ